jgi:hypothetical protein
MFFLMLSIGLVEIDFVRISFVSMYHKTFLQIFKLFLLQLFFIKIEVVGMYQKICLRVLGHFNYYAAKFVGIARSGRVAIQPAVGPTRANLQTCLKIRGIPRCGLPQKGTKKAPTLRSGLIKEKRVVVSWCTWWLPPPRDPS